MITDSLKKDVDRLWEKFWTGGIANPLTVIEQISYLLFARMLDIAETRGERRAARGSKKDTVDVPSLDLHGVAQDRVEARLEQFLYRSREGRHRQVELITGRGASNHSGPPVLQKKVVAWLDKNKSRIGLVQKQVTNQGGALLLDLAPLS